MSSGRTTFYRGLRMRSRLEADFARYLIGEPGVEWLYEPFAFADERGQYLPDFWEPSSDGWPPTCWEVKPAELFDDSAALAAVAAQISIVWSSEPSALLIVQGWSWGAEPAQVPCLMAFGHPHDVEFRPPGWAFAPAHGSAVPYDGPPCPGEPCSACLTAVSS